MTGGCSTKGRKAKKPTRRARAAAPAKPIDRPRYRFVLYLLPLILFISLVFGVPGLYLAGLVPETLGNVLETILLSFLFSSMALAWLAYRGLSLGGMAHSLGLDRFSPRLEAVGWALALFVMSFIVEILIGIFQTVTNIPCPRTSGPSWGGCRSTRCYSPCSLCPINEEILFRGLLVPRLGHMGQRHNLRPGPPPDLRLHIRIRGRARVRPPGGLRAQEDQVALPLDHRAHAHKPARLHVAREDLMPWKG